MIFLKEQSFVASWNEAVKGFEPADSQLKILEHRIDKALHPSEFSTCIDVDKGYYVARIPSGVLNTKVEILIKHDIYTNSVILIAVTDHT